MQVGVAVIASTATQTLYTTLYGKIQQKQKSYFLLYSEYTLLHTKINL